MPLLTKLKNQPKPKKPTIGTLNHQKKFAENLNTESRPSLTKSFIRSIPQNFKMKKLKTLSKSNHFTSTTPIVKKHKGIFKTKITSVPKPKGKIDIFFEFEKKTLMIQTNIRRLLAVRKMERLKITSIIQGNNSSFDDNQNNNDKYDMDISNQKLTKQITFKKDSNTSSLNSSEKCLKSKVNNLTKNKSANLLGIQQNMSLHNSMKSLRSGVSKVSLDSDDINFTDEDDEEYF